MLTAENLVLSIEAWLVVSFMVLSSGYEVIYMFRLTLMGGILTNSSSRDPAMLEGTLNHGV